MKHLGLRLAVTALLTTSCASAEIDDLGTSADGTGTGAGTGGGKSGPGGSGGGSTTPGGGSTTPGATPGSGPDPVLLPARVRRLSNYEYDRTIAALFGADTSPAKSFAADFRQSDFTQNAAQQVDSTYATQLQGTAQTLAHDNLMKLIAGAGCAPTAGEACATQFIASFGQQAYRRPLTDDEKAGLLAVFRAGAKDATFNDGIETVLWAILQSPNFLYVTELGTAPPRNGVVRLSDHEIASALSYLVTGGPPDAMLMTAAQAGKLGNAADREMHARRLLALPAARPQIARLVKEWLGLDRIEGTGKDKTVYPKYDDLRPSIAAESDAFIGEAVFGDDGTITKVLTADYTVADQKLAQFYGLPFATAGKRIGYGTVPRRGVIMQSAFLSVFAHDNETAPVKRGNAILRKVMCVILPLPGELNLKVVPPPPDPKKTTRERFTQHSTDAACAGCHAIIDPIGFSLENFDGMGGLRTTENGKPVVTQADVKGADVSGTVKDGAELMGKLGASDEVKKCFARNLFRFAAAQAGEGYEAMFFQTVWDKLPAGKKIDVKEMLVALAASDPFINRRVP